MSNRDLVIALRNSLDGIMTKEQIDQAIQGELKEKDIEKNYPASVGLMSPPDNNQAFTRAFNTQISDHGGMWLGKMWDLRGYELTGPLQRVAPEECNAISNHGPTNQFDAAKGLTNILRMIKVGSTS